MAERCIEQCGDTEKPVDSPCGWNKLLARHRQPPLLLVIAFGFLVRSINYVRDDSLTLDENLLALNIVYRPLGRLLHPLRFEQSAPPLFLWAQRLTINALGVSERALRLIPLIAGVVLIYGKLAMSLGNIEVAGFTAALMAVSPCTIQYSTQAKQYSLDPTVSVLLVILTLTVIKKPEFQRWLILFC